MNLRYTRKAVRQIDAALSYLRRHSPTGADNVSRRLMSLIAMIRQHPHAGHRTSRAGVLRITVAPYPYLIDYRPTDTTIISLRFRHAARRPID